MINATGGIATPKGTPVPLLAQTKAAEGQVNVMRIVNGHESQVNNVPEAKKGAEQMQTTPTQPRTPGTIRPMKG